MPTKIRKISHVLFSTHIFLAIVFNLIVFLGVGVFTSYSWSENAPIFSKLFKIDALGLLSSIMLVSFGEYKWKKIKNLVKVNFVWASINLIGSVMMQFTHTVPGNLMNVAYYHLCVVLYMTVLILQKFPQRKGKMLEEMIPEKEVVVLQA